MNTINKILIIIQRSNGDVFLSSSLIDALIKNYKNPQIDILVNDDTLAIAKTLEHIKNIHLFSYKKKKISPLKQEINLIKNIYKKYDLSICLTSSDRSVLYAILSARYSISAIESNEKKSWWKKLFLTKIYKFDHNLSIVENNAKSLELLDIKLDKLEIKSHYSDTAKQNMIKKLKEKNIQNFIIFHPSAQYDYKIYPKELRSKLLEMLNTLNMSIVITGGTSDIDFKIKKNIPKLKNIYDFIGETNLDEYIALSDMSSIYIGMDTLNMHIAASQNKRIFAIFGPTLVSIWSPWCNSLQMNTKVNTPKQTYGNITIFQADLSCVSCGLAGCDNNNGASECLNQINPEIIFKEVAKCIKI